MKGTIPTEALLEGLFLSDLQASQMVTPHQARMASLRTLRIRGGKGACAEAVASEFGEHPETAVARMRWARNKLGLAA